MSKPLTTQQAAATLGLHVETVRRLCREHGIGEQVNPQLRLLYPADVAKLRKLKRPVGNPAWTKAKRKRK